MNAATPPLFMPNWAYTPHGGTEPYSTQSGGEGMQTLAGVPRSPTEQTMSTKYMVYLTLDQMNALLKYTEGKPPKDMTKQEAVECHKAIRALEQRVARAHDIEREFESWEAA